MKILLLTFCKLHCGVCALSFAEFTPDCLASFRTDNRMQSATTTCNLPLALINEKTKIGGFTNEENGINFNNSKWLVIKLCH